MGLLSQRRPRPAADHCAGGSADAKACSLTNAAPPSASARNIRAISDLEHAALAKRSAGERCADRVASAAGKVWFTVGHFVFFVVWLSLNVGSVPGFTA